MFIDRHDITVWQREKIECNLSFVRTDGDYSFSIVEGGVRLNGTAKVQMRFDRSIGQCVPYVVKFWRTQGDNRALQNSPIKIRKAQ